MENIPVVIPVDDFVLRKLTKKDAQAITDHINSDIVRYTQNIPFPYSVDDGKKFVLKSIKEWRKGRGYVFGIMQDNTLIGICSIDAVNKDNKQGELGYWLAKEFWGKGMMTKAASAVVRFGFEELGLHRIYVIHFEENVASRRVIEKLGFVLEGKEREAIYRFEQWHTLYKYGLLEEEWKAKR
ncbi:MAG: GNAT family N-acetyltransferase [Nanoarchaeota archaeon]